MKAHNNIFFNVGLKKTKILRLNFLFEFVMKKAAHEIVIESLVARSAEQPESANARESSRIQILIYG